MKTSQANHTLAILFVASLLGTTSQAQFVYETDQEFITTGDFNGDQQVDIAIVDKFTGRVRVGFRISAEFFDWSNWRAGGLEGVTGVTVGKLTDPRHDSLALASPDVGFMTVVNAVDPKIETDPGTIPSAVVGPGTILASDFAGPGKSAFPGLYVSTSVDPIQATLLRNEGKGFKQFAQVPLNTEPETRANRVSLQAGAPEQLVMLAGEKAKTLLVKKVTGSKLEEVLKLANLPENAHYVVGNFRGTALKDFIFYTTGESNLLVSALSESAGRLSLGAPRQIGLGRAIRHVVTVAGEKRSRLLATFGDEAPAELMDFDGVNPPVRTQALAGLTNRYLKTGISVPGALVLFSILTNDLSRPVMFYQTHVLQGDQSTHGPGGGLPDLDNRDDSTVSNIHARIVANLREKNPPAMQAYTNPIPGSEVLYRMVPIPGGEFLMGSPPSEPGRTEAEGPQHRVQISPFWMGQFEVTWEEYLLFQYPDDEKALRKQYPSGADSDELTDAVTRPSKPYPDMSFGMGRKKGLPVIAMTQHSANKYCHWLSAKTGHFYRLPTEAEWEYACRAGTTTAYYFGNDPLQITNYAWCYENSVSSYHKVGTKLPNAWGLYDMGGNVEEWVLDQFDAGYYQTLAAAKVTLDPWRRATQPYPHSVRGGSFDDDAPALRSAARDKSDRDWKATFPNLPKSIWHLSDCKTVGFRIVRPLKVPSPEEMAKYWISGVEKD